MLNKKTQKSKPKPTCNVNCSHVCVCESLCTTVVHNTSKNSFNYFPPNIQTIIIAQMLSIGGRGQSRVTNISPKEI